MSSFGPTSLRLAICAFVVAFVSTSLAVAPVLRAADVDMGDLIIEAPWSRATPGGAKVGVGYAAIVNVGDKTRRLKAAVSPIAERIELHSVKLENGVVRMRRVENGIELPPQTVTELKPGGYHLMLIGLKQPIVEGDRIPIQLTFDGDDKADVVFHAASIGARYAPGSTEILPSGSSSGANADSSDGQPRGSTAGTPQKGSH